MTETKIGVLSIGSPAIYTDQTLATASWYDQYVLLPGTYDVFHDPSRSSHTVVFRIDAVLLESYRVNRLFTASSSELTRPLRVVTLTRDMRAYEFARGVAQGEEIWNGTVHLDDNARATTREIAATASPVGRTITTGDLFVDDARVA